MILRHWPCGTFVRFCWRNVCSDCDIPSIRLRPWSSVLRLRRDRPVPNGRRRPEPRFVTLWSDGKSIENEDAILHAGHHVRRPRNPKVSAPRPPPDFKIPVWVGSNVRAAIFHPSSLADEPQRHRVDQDYPIGVVDLSKESRRASTVCYICLWKCDLITGRIKGQWPWTRTTVGWKNVLPTAKTTQSGPERVQRDKPPQGWPYPFCETVRVVRKTCLRVSLVSCFVGLVRN